MAVLTPTIGAPFVPTKLGTFYRSKSQTAYDEVYVKASIP